MLITDKIYSITSSLIYDLLQLCYSNDPLIMTCYSYATVIMTCYSYESNEPN